MTDNFVYTAFLDGSKAYISSVVADTTDGLNYEFSLVGLPDKSVKESEDRVMTALKNSGIKYNKSDKEKIVISLHPGDQKKDGSHFDTSILIAYLISKKSIILSDKYLLVGELSLSGELQKAKGVLAMTISAKKHGIKNIIVPIQNKQEASLVEGVNVFGAKTILEVYEHLKGVRPITPETHSTDRIDIQTHSEYDMSHIEGQQLAKRALTIASAGGHNIALYGPPGTGKTMLAKAFVSIMPPLTYDKAVESYSISSILGQNKQFTLCPPFRAPHHTSSFVSLVGGGQNPKPGEVTLAHNGVLFMDEFPLFDSRALEALREPLEEKIIRVSRAKGSHTFEADITLVAAFNPCPCGFSGSDKECVCNPGQISKYRKKLSGPIADRIDMWIPVNTVSFDKLMSHDSSKEVKSEILRAVSIKARNKSRQRLKGLDIKGDKNGDITSKDIEKIMPESQEIRDLLNQMATKYNLSGRSFHRIIKVARTIADLQDHDEIEKSDILEAFSYRPKVD